MRNWVSLNSTGLSARRASPSNCASLSVSVICASEGVLPSPSDAVSSAIAFAADTRTSSSRSNALSIFSSERAAASLSLA